MILITTKNNNIYSYKLLTRDARFSDKVYIFDVETMIKTRIVQSKILILKLYFEKGLSFEQLNMH